MSLTDYSSDQLQRELNKRRHRKSTQEAISFLVKEMDDITEVRFETEEPDSFTVPGDSFLHQKAREGKTISFDIKGGAQ